MSSDPVYAHSLSNLPPEKWELLETHLAEVAERCEQYAAAFHAGEWGWIAGRCHDLGKASAEFQRYICQSTDRENAGEESSSPQRVNHSTFGARYVAHNLRGPEGRILAFCIAGHHAGLADAWPESESANRSSLNYRLSEESIPSVPFQSVALRRPPLYLRASSAPRDFSLAFFVRMLFSCLVDADRTCTESFCDPKQALERSIARPTLAQLREKLDVHLRNKKHDAPNTLVNAQRQTILQNCLDAAQCEPGFFSLQVPTGGGKTLSSLAFALHHAKARMERIIMAIPFTSIVEQTADVYRDALGPLAPLSIVEHHSNLKPERETRANQLGTENWDAPLIVTTNVQLFESMFAASTTPCRKLHRLTNSIIILDEAQTLPVELLKPTLHALRELVNNYGCTVVLCTATQPALEKRDDFSIGLEGVRPIIPDAPRLFEIMRRVRVQHIGTVEDDDLTNRIAAEHQVLCIVNTRRHAAELFDRVHATASDVFHLSTLMCGAHRRMILRKIRRRLLHHLPCRVISTQVIEAGVDIDLPVVYRAATGFDSLAQAAGRCNREGKVPLGTTYIFDTEELPPPGMLRTAANTAKEIWKDGIDPLSPSTIQQYFRLMYWKHSADWDKHEVMPCMALDRNRPAELRFQFREIARRYVMIRNEQLPILIPYGKNVRQIVADLTNPSINFVSHRRLQPYLVSVPRNALRSLEENQVVQAHSSGVWLLLRDDAYSCGKGLTLGPLSLDSALWGI
jgi:CRISPR-associated endonuclease/helicase Cas3